MLFGGEQASLQRTCSALGTLILTDVVPLYPLSSDHVDLTNSNFGSDFYNFFPDRITIGSDRTCISDQIKNLDKPSDSKRPIRSDAHTNEIQMHKYFYKIMLDFTGLFVRSTQKDKDTFNTN